MIDEKDIFKCSKQECLECRCYKLWKRLYDKKVAGIQRAKKEGKYTGRQPMKIDGYKFELLYSMYRYGQINKSDMASKLGISRPTLRKHWDEWVDAYTEEEDTIFHMARGMRYLDPCPRPGID